MDLIEKNKIKGGKEMSRTILVNAEIITPYRVLKGHSVIINGSRIEDVIKTDEASSYENLQVIDAQGCYVMPGFIDMHVHGGGGADFMEGTERSIGEISAFHMKHGTTTMLLTTNCAPMDKIFSVIDKFREVKSTRAYPNLLGVHLEGPFVSTEQLGALNVDACKSPDAEDIKKILCYEDVISRITAAPEIYGTLTMAEKLRNYDILFSVGHSNANNEDMLRALESGYSHITHFYSATSTVRRINAYRVSGVIESGYLLDGYTVEVIADGHHLPPDLLKLIYKIKGSARIALVTDSICAAGLPEGQKAKGSGGREIIIEGGVAKLPDRSAFAGSVSTMDLLVKNMFELAEVPLNETVKMATATPARILRLDKKKGIVNPGMDADLVVMDREFRVRLVMSDGKVFYDRSEII